jgi:hypothetical protein
MGLTLSNIDNSMLGNKLLIMADCAFDSSYAHGGEALTPNKFGLGTINRLTIDPCQGYSFEYDYTNQKIKVFQNAPPIVHEEVVTVTSNVGYLKWPAAHIEYVTDDSNDYRVIPGGLTPTAKMVAVDMGFNLSTGVLTKGQRCKLTFLAADSVTSCKVSYITQAWKDVTDNMVQACMTSGSRTYGHADMSFTAGWPDVVKLGEDFVALQSVCWSNGGTLTPMSALKDDATEGAGATECVVDFRKATTYGEIGFNETDAVDTSGDIIYFNYIKDPGSGFLYDRFTNAEIEDSSDTLTFTGTPLLYCTCGGIPMESTTKKCLMTGVGDTVAAGEGHWTSHPYLPSTTLAIAPIITMHGDTDDDSFPAWICGDPSEIETVPLECPNAVNLSNLSSVKVTAIGY